MRNLVNLSIRQPTRSPSVRSSEVFYIREVVTRTAEACDETHAIWSTAAETHEHGSGLLITDRDRVARCCTHRKHGCSVRRTEPSRVQRQINSTFDGEKFIGNARRETSRSPADGRTASTLPLRYDASVRFPNKCQLTNRHAKPRSHTDSVEITHLFWFFIAQDFNCCKI